MNVSVRNRAWSDTRQPDLINTHSQPKNPSVPQSRSHSMDDDTDPQSLLQFVLGFLARKRPESSAKSASLRSRKREGWLRADAFAAFEKCDGLRESDLGSDERVARTLRAFDRFVQDDSDRETDVVGIPEVQQVLIFQSASLSLLAY